MYMHTLCSSQLVSMELQPCFVPCSGSMYTFLSCLSISWITAGEYFFHVIPTCYAIYLYESRCSCRRGTGTALVLPQTWTDAEGCLKTSNWAEGGEGGREGEAEEWMWWEKKGSWCEDRMGQWERLRMSSMLPVLVLKLILFPSE